MNAAALVAAHAAVHAALEERAWVLLERLVRLDIGAARAAWATWRALFVEHVALEDERVLPTYEQVAPKEGPGRLDHVEGDHTILDRHVDAIDTALAQLGEAPVLRAVLSMLPLVYKLLGTFEHHTIREQAHVYPAVAAALDDASRHDVTAALTSLVDRALAP